MYVLIFCRKNAVLLNYFDNERNSPFLEKN